MLATEETSNVNDKSDINSFLSKYSGQLITASSSHTFKGIGILSIYPVGGNIMRQNYRLEVDQVDQVVE
jgi:hypothetical protein